MNKPNVAKLVHGVKSSLTVHAPEILTGVGIAGMITSTVLAVKVTPKATKLIADNKKELKTDKLNPVETVKTCWKCYIPATLTCVTSVACIIGASTVGLRRNAALATAYKLSESALAEYREQVVETVGEKKERAIRDKVDKAFVDKRPVNEEEIIITGNGKSLCLDYCSGRYFYSDIEIIRKAVNTLNKSLIHDMCGYCSLNDLYDEIGLPHTGTGDILGWNVSKGLIQEHIGSQITNDGRPAIVLTFDDGPYYDYEDM